MRVQFKEEAGTLPGVQITLGREEALAWTKELWGILQGARAAQKAMEVLGAPAQVTDLVFENTEAIANQMVRLFPEVTGP